MHCIDLAELFNFPFIFNLAIAELGKSLGKCVFCLKVAGSLPCHSSPENNKLLVSPSYHRNVSAASQSQILPYAV